MNKKIDFNCDMGESFGMHKLGMDEEVIKYITSANIACGFHSGDPNWIYKTVKLAENSNVPTSPVAPNEETWEHFRESRHVETFRNVSTSLEYFHGSRIAETWEHSQHRKLLEIVSTYL